MLILNTFCSIKNQQTRFLKLHYLRSESDIFFHIEIGDYIQSNIHEKNVLLPLSLLLSKYNKYLPLSFA